MHWQGINFIYFYFGIYLYVRIYFGRVIQPVAFNLRSHESLSILHANGARDTYFIRMEISCRGTCKQHSEVVIHDICAYLPLRGLEQFL